MIGIKEIANAFQFCYKEKPPMKRLAVNKFIISLLLIVFVIRWASPVIAEEAFLIFSEVFSKVLDSYVEQPDVTSLASSAISGMEDMLISRNKMFAKPDINFQDIKGDRTNALNVVSSTFRYFLNASGMHPKELEHAAIKGILKSLDPHSGYIAPEEYKEMQVEIKGEFGGLGIQIALKEEILTVIAPIEDTPAYRAGIKAGDRILKINNESTKGMALSEAVRRMRGLRGTKVTLTIMRDDFIEPKDFEIIRDIIRIVSVKSHLLEEGIGYIRITQFQENAANDVEEALKRLGSRDNRLKGLVLDLRNNPGGLLSEAINIADKFIDSGIIIQIKGRSPDSSQKFEGKTLGTHPIYPLVVLVNEGTASGSEILAGALQDYNKAATLGKRSFGKGTVQTLFPLSDGSALRLTTAQYYLPSGKAIQGGIMPDIEIEDQEGKDIPLYTAQKALKQTSGLSIDKLKKTVHEVLKERGVETVKLTPSTRPDEKLPPLRQDTYAVVIGIDYKNRNDIPNLQYASQDAKKIYSILTDPKYGGVPKENAVLLLNEKATRNEMISALRKIKNWDGYVYVYYSGHGAPKTKGDKFIDAFLVPNDVVITDPEAMEDTAIKVSYLQELIETSNAKGVMLALDACFSGGGKSIVPKGGKPLVGMLVSPEIIKPRGTGKVIITSSATNQQSWEDEAELKSGIFSHYLLEGLKGKASKDVWVKVDELAEYIKDNVSKAARKLKGQEQQPQITGRADFAVTRNWERAKVMDIEIAREKLKGAFEKGSITVKQLNMALDELKTQKRSKTLEAFLAGEIDEKKFGELY